MRRQKIAWLALIFAFVVMVVLYAYRTIRDIDHQYSSLITEGTRQLRIIENLTFDSNRSYALLLMAIQADPAKAAEAIHERNKILVKNSRILDSLLGSASSDSLKAQIQRVMSARASYLKKYNHIVSEYVEKRVTPDFRLISEDIDPSFMSYQREINNLFSRKHEHIYVQSNDFSQQAKSTANMLLLMTISPVAIISILVALAVFFIYYIMKDLDAERV